MMTLLRACSSLPALHDKPEHTMTPTTPLIPIRARRSPVPFTSLQHLFHPIQTRHDLLPEGREHNFTTCTTLELHEIARSARRRGEEVVYRLVIYLEVRAPEEVFARRCAADEGEYVFHCARDDPGLVVIPTQSECFPGRGLSVCEDDGIEAIHCGVNV